MADSIRIRRRAAAASTPTGRGDTIIVGVLLLAVALVAALLFLLAIGVLAPERVLADASLRKGLLGWLAVSSWIRAATAGGSLVLGLLALYGLARRLAPGSPRAPDVHLLVADELGVVVVSREGIEGIARRAAQGSAGIVDADVRVHGRGSDAVALRIHAEVLPGADLQRAGAQLRDRTREAVERLVGLNVQEVAVRLEVLSNEDLSRTVL